MLSPPSIWAGQKTPDLNNERRFLRGGSDQEGHTLEADMVMDHTHDIADPGHGHDYYDQYSYGDNVHSYILSYPTWSGGKYTERLRTSDSNFTGISVTGWSVCWIPGRRRDQAKEYECDLCHACLLTGKHQRYFKSCS